MNAFKFSLQKILDLREFQKKQAQVELGKVVAEETRIQNRINEIAVSRANSVKLADSMRDIRSLYDTNMYLLFLEQQKEKKISELAEVKIVADEKRAVMRTAIQNCKVLENLKERRKEIWQKEFDLEEENAIDEIVTEKFGNKV